MDNAVKQKLIEEVHGQEALWNKQLEEYKNNNIKADLWNKIASKLKLAKNQCQNVWKDLKKKFGEELKHVENSYRSGNGLEDVYESDWEFYDSLVFLKDQFLPDDTVGNLDGLIKSNKKVKIMSRRKRKSPERSSPVANIEELSEEGKLDKYYFDNLVRHIERLPRHKKLLLQNEINAVVFKHAYPEQDWSPLNQGFPYKNNSRQIKQSLSVQKDILDDDEIQIVEENLDPNLSKRLNYRKVHRVKQEKCEEQVFIKSELTKHNNCVNSANYANDNCTASTPVEVAVNNYDSTATPNRSATHNILPQSYIASQPWSFSGMPLNVTSNFHTSAGNFPTSTGNTENNISSQSVGFPTMPYNTTAYYVNTNTSNIPSAGVPENGGYLSVPCTGTFNLQNNVNSETEGSGGATKSQETILQTL